MFYLKQQLLLRKYTTENADPKSVFYIFFMQEQCTEGEKCKFYLISDGKM